MFPRFSLIFVSHFLHVVVTYTHHSPADYFHCELSFNGISERISAIYPQWLLDLIAAKKVLALLHHRPGWITFQPRTPDTFWRLNPADAIQALHSLGINDFGNFLFPWHG